MIHSLKHKRNLILTLNTKKMIHVFQKMKHIPNDSHISKDKIVYIDRKNCPYRQEKQISGSELLSF